MIYHIVPKNIWEKYRSKKHFVNDTLTNDGFIHFALLNQVVFIASLLYPDRRDDLVILEADESKIISPVFLEDIQGHGLFPHLYGKLNLDSVIAIYSLLIDNRERSRVKCMLPDTLRLPRVKMN